MSALVVYDTRYGNTEKIASAIASGLGDRVPVHSIDKIDPAALPALDLLVVGSPTQGGRPTADLNAWLARFPPGKLSGVRVAAFDTRIQAREQGFMLRTLMGVIGYAAPPILKGLVEAGGVAGAAAEGFIVEGREGPLRDGEPERAAAWGKALVSAS